MNIVFVSHSAFEPDLVVGSHHLSRSLAELGHGVLHISCPISPLHFLKLHNGRMRRRVFRSFKGLQSISNNLYEWIPFVAVPWQVARRGELSRRNLFVPAQMAVNSRLRQCAFFQVDAAVIDEPRLVGIEKHLKPRKIIYRATDLYAKMRNDNRILAAERLLAVKSDRLIGTSEPVSQHLNSLGSERRAITIRNGVDIQHFSNERTEPASLQGIPHPRVVYVGAIDDRFDNQGIRQLAVACPDLQFLMFGPMSGSIAGKTENSSNLHYLGPVDYADVPAVLQHCEVGIIPTNDHPANVARSPMKFYEYAAAGLPVVARRTNEMSTRSEDFLYLYEESSSMEAFLRKALRYDQKVNSEALHPHSWLCKTQQLIDIIAMESGDSPKLSLANAKQLLKDGK